MSAVAPLQNQLIIFVKTPRPGAVKTRLAAEIGAAAACHAYRRLVMTVLDRMQVIPETELRFAPDDAGPEITPWLRNGWTARPQGEGDLGERMARAFEDAGADGACRVVIIGSDCPDVTAADIEQAWLALEEHDLVLGPATDGGYWLIALQQPQPSLFHDIPWSSEHVLQETLQRATAAGLRVHQLRTLSDVDTAEDWRALLARGFPV